MLHFATLFNIGYLSRAIVCLSSLQKHCRSKFTYYILCLDDTVFDYFTTRAISNIVLIKLSDVEKKYPELIAAKNNRRLAESYFTLSPFLPLYILETFQNVDCITSLDADLCFVSDPTPILVPEQLASINITPHNFCAGLQPLEVYGKYNVSFQTFKRDAEGLLCLREWASDCVAWCYDRLEGEKFADQKYLDSWEAKYTSVQAFANKGIGVAPWNVRDVTLTYNSNQQLCINDHHTPIIFYHYQGLTLWTKRWISVGMLKYNKFVSKKIITYLYDPYLRAVLSNTQENSKGNHKSLRHKQLVLTTLWSRDLYYWTGKHLVRVHNLYFLKAILLRLRNILRQWTR